MFFKVWGIQGKRVVVVGIRRAKSDRTFVISCPLQKPKIRRESWDRKKLQTLGLRLSHESSDIDNCLRFDAMTREAEDAWSLRARPARSGKESMRFISALMESALPKRLRQRLYDMNLWNSRTF